MNNMHTDDNAIDIQVGYTVIGIFENTNNVEIVTQQLQKDGYTPDDISVLMQPAGTPPEFDADHTEANKGMVAGLSVGAAIGGLAGLAALTVPGIGPILAAGPLAAVLTTASGAAVGSALGGLIGTFAGLGVPTEQAEAYDAAIRAGGIVVAVRVPDPTTAAKISNMLDQRGATQVAHYARTL
ncbi:MAG: low temperature-induced protein [Chloroflexota bacterium]